MISDTRGDLGFTESMLSFMAVTTVLGLYLMSLAYASPLVEDPLSDLDVSEFGIDLSSEEPVSLLHLEEFMAVEGLSGVSILLETFGITDPREILAGSVTDSVFRSTFLILSEFEHGRTIPVKVVVTAYA